jgi:hypothetical protein
LSQLHFGGPLSLQQELTAQTIAYSARQCLRGTPTRPPTVENGTISAYPARTSFQPGQKGGPGRPPRDVAVPTANAAPRVARSFSEEALKTLVKIMRDSDAPGAVRLRAVEALLTRGFGLPTQPIDVTISRVLAKKLCECTGRALRRRAVSRTSRAPFPLWPGPHRASIGGLR